MTERPTINMLISGVGGQGVVLASYVLSHVAMAEGYDVKQSEVHGMTQRGGSVTSHLRFGDKVYSPLITPGHGRHPALVRVAGGPALRPLAQAGRPARLQRRAREPEPGLVRRWPSTRTTSTSASPRRGRTSRAVDANALAAKAGTVKAANVVMLGAMASALPFTPETWRASSARRCRPRPWT